MILYKSIKFLDNIMPDLNNKLLKNILLDNNISVINTVRKNTNSATRPWPSHEIVYRTIHFKSFSDKDISNVIDI